MGVESSSWGGSWDRIFPFSSRWTAAGFFPRNVLVSMGSAGGRWAGLSPGRRSRGACPSTPGTFGGCPCWRGAPRRWLPGGTPPGWPGPTSWRSPGRCGRILRSSGLGWGTGPRTGGRPRTFSRPPAFSSGPRRSGGPHWRTGARTPAGDTPVGVPDDFIFWVDPFHKVSLLSEGVMGALPPQCPQAVHGLPGLVRAAKGGEAEIPLPVFAKARPRGAHDLGALQKVVEILPAPHAAGTF